MTIRQAAPAVPAEPGERLDRPGARTRRGWADRSAHRSSPGAAAPGARRASRRGRGTASAVPTASWAPISHRSSTVRRAVADVVVRTAHGPSSNSTIDGTANERSVPTVRARSSGSPATGTRPAVVPAGRPATSSVVLACSRRSPWSMATTTSVAGPSCAEATTTTGRPAPVAASRAASIPAAATVGRRRAGRDVWRRPRRPGAPAHPPSWPTSVSSRRHGQHGADAGERLVELGGGQLGRRRQLPVTLGAELIAAAERGRRCPSPRG